MPAALRLLHGDLAKYRRLLRLFATAHGDDVAAMQRHVAEGRHDDAADLCELLSANAALLGASRLAGQVAALAGMLRSAAPAAGYDALAARCEAELRALVKTIEHLPNPDAGIALPAQDARRVPAARRTRRTGHAGRASLRPAAPANGRARTRR